ncbi:two-component system regulatory protein YycI [Vagococcus lutrae]|uniref:two-component system regulatory protein YycI n=1 Tax=Vagococcus lutrae TaxID=81947 RepID=UPI00288ED002|nr:two-component system regulatory protein YycI [Vagococcus lutrae]MDT2807364.1 two-component system regulatory protein YycI [Vagococcus lutrae]
MDFKRIEFIFLVTFLSLNLFLAFSYFQGQAETTQLPESSYLDNIESRLKEEKITIPHDFSTQEREGYYLSALPTNFEERGVTKNARLNDAMTVVEDLENVPIVDIPKKNVRQEVESFVTNSEDIAERESYTYSSALSEPPYVFVYTQSFEGIPFYDGSSKLVVTLEDTANDRLTLSQFSQTHIEDVEPLREKQVLITEHDAIVTLYLASRIPNGATIKQTTLAYTKIFSVRGKDVYVPTWLIWIENKDKELQIEKINAFSNSIISSGMSEVRKETF